MKTFIFFGFLLSLVNASAFCDGNTIISAIARIESRACLTQGVCDSVEFDPVTGEYSYKTGFRDNCPGMQERTVTDYFCQVEDVAYQFRTEEGPWGLCHQ